MTSAADGGDYTWQNSPGGAVLNSASHTVCEVCGQPATEILCGTIPAGVENGWQLFKPGIRHCYCASCATAAHIEPLDQKLAELAEEVRRLRRDLATLRLSLEQMFEIRL